MKKGMLFIAIFSFAVIFGLLSAEGASAADMTISKSLSAKYYSIPVVTNDIANLAPSDSRLLSQDKMILETIDMISMFDLPQTDERRFPDFDSLPGEPKYFAAHWSGSVVVSKDGDYRVTLSSHEASQLFINGVRIISVTPNDQYGGMSLMVNLKEGVSNVDVFFAKRSDFQSGLVFKIDDASFNSIYQEDLPKAEIIQSLIQESSKEDAISSNIVPRVVSFNPPKAAEAGQYFAYKVLGENPSGAVLEYKLMEAPQGMTIGQSSGYILWKPSQNQAYQAPHPVVISISDGVNTSNSRFEISEKIPVTNSALFGNKTNNQVSGNVASEPTPTIFAENISVFDKSEKETSAPAGSSLSASVLFTGVFTLGRWFVSRFMSIVYFFVSLALTGLVVYVFLEIIDRNKKNKKLNRP
ncbi:MAG: hypothetical protein AAB795_04020, partial [Patescibacteria group bacterium]